MNLIWRFIWVILFSRFASKLGLFDECTITFRVLPTDIDVLTHMNNGRYFSLLDLARIDCMIRNNAFHTFKQHKIYPVVASEMIRFKKSLRLFQRFEITTRIIGWDDKFFYIAHYFKTHGEICALALVKACCLRKSKGLVNTSEVLNLLDVKSPALQMPDWVKEWNQADQDFYDHAMGEELKI